MSRVASGGARGGGGGVAPVWVGARGWCSGGGGECGGAVGVGGDGPAERLDLVQLAASDPVGVLASVEVVAAELVPGDVVVKDVPAADEDAVADGFACA